MRSVQSVQSYWLGRARYAPVHELQRELVQARIDGHIGDTLLLLEHEPVVTLGRGAKAEHVLVSVEERARIGLDLEETGRGGDVTYHGPGQLVGYPIVALRPSPDPARPFGEQDLHGYLRALEDGLLLLLTELGVACDRKPSYTGIWTADKTGKLASLGVAVRRWVTSHGFALNVTTELSRFFAINPCGMQAQIMTSLQQLETMLDGQPVTLERLTTPCAKAIGQALGRRFVLRNVADSGLGPLLDEAAAHPEPALPVSD